jgi:tetratricopeptide (TPR) repeat protein
MLARLGHVDLILWIVGRLTDGLAHAHDRGILHLDLKPANVLLADDGQPLLLDFNLSFDTTAGERERAGGTLPYMAPEQLEEYRDGGPTRVDHRSDLYALGVIFFELLTGKHPFQTSQRPGIAELIEVRRVGPPPTRRLSPGLSPAVAAIVRKLLQFDPAKRYQSARELLTDLDRHAHNLPLLFAPNPSLTERVRKWRRRHPRAGLKAVLAAAVLAAAGFGVMARQQAQARSQTEAAANAKGLHDDLIRLRVDLAVRDDAAVRQAGLTRGTELLARYGLPEKGSGWADGPDVRCLPPEVRATLADDLGELCLLMAHAEWLGSRGKGPMERAVAWNKAAESAYAGRPVPGAVDDQKRFLAGADEYGPASPAPTGVDLYLRAAERMAGGRFADAAELLEALTDRDPGHAAGQFSLGVCRMELGEFVRALERFQVARGLTPNDPRPAFNRGLILMRQPERVKDAEKEFTDALAKDPKHAQAYKHRALTRQARYPRGAVEDLTRALECGLPPIQGHLIRARVYDQLGERAKAAADRAAAAGLTPLSPEDHIARGLGRLEVRPKPDVPGALADFAAAAELNPNYLPAWQNQAAVLSDWLAQPVKALDLQQKAVAVAPDFAPARVGLAVLLARLGRRDEAHAEAQKALVLSADPEVTYQAACVYSLTSKTHPADRGTALDLFRKSLREGFRKFRDIDADPDVNPIRQAPEFQATLKAAKELVR